MSYQTKSVLNIIKEIESSKVYLPALQRKFVWDKGRIQLLFDSMMRNFPIGTFLFWNLEKEVADNYVFYEFLKEYDERNPYNKKKVGHFLNPDIIGVLDGQQRLSSMYIGLQGTHTEREKGRHYSNQNAYKKTELYLNLLSLPFKVSSEDTLEFLEDQNFEFRFLSEHESKSWIFRTSKKIDENGNEITQEEYMFWFKVGKVLSWNEDPEYDQIFEKLETFNENQLKSIIENKRFIKRAFETLNNRIKKDKLINYFEVNKKDLEDILKIFVRVNTGGILLNRTDLLFSTIVATWENGREEIENLLKEINSKGDRFSFSNEYLMRACLVLTDSPVLFKVNSFKTENVQKIKNEWKNIASAIRKTVDLLVEFGFSDSFLTSQNSTIIISYYIYKGGILNDATKFEIKKYLVHALLTGIYGGSQDQLITSLRNYLRVIDQKEGEKENYKLKNISFSFDDLLKLELPSRKSIYIEENEIDNFFNYRKGSGSFLVLSLLYPQLKYKEVQFHQDHIHPSSKFNKEIFEQIGLSPELQEEWLNLRDTVPNLQLMEGRENESKNNSSFKEWINRKEIREQENFKVNNYIPYEVSLDFNNFKSFYDCRKTLLKAKLKEVLAIKKIIQADDDIYIETGSGIED